MLRLLYRDEELHQKKLFVWMRVSYTFRLAVVHSFISTITNWLKIVSFFFGKKFYTVAPFEMC